MPFSAQSSNFTNQIMVKLCRIVNCIHSSTLILETVYRISLLLLQCPECDLTQVCTNQRRRCQYQGYSCRTALDQLSKQRRKLSQGSLSPYIMYTCSSSAIISSMTSREALPQINHNRNTNSESGNRSFWTAFFTHKMTGKNYQWSLATVTLPRLSKITKALSHDVKP